MKRFLSLVLTLVMVMSLVTVSAGAKDFTDDDAIAYDEAVAVVSTVGIVDGYPDDSFKPANTLTRQAAAKIICNLILGPTTAAELHADTAPYKDVPVNGEFAGYIAYCQSKGIISGYADGSFRPGGTLTGYAFMKMLLGALGYDANLENYVGPNWSINVAKQALGIGLDDGLETKEGAEFNGIKAVTREEACLYAFNTLQADLVEYNQRLTTSINGTEVTLSSGGAQSRTWASQQSRNNNIVNDNIIQFAEEYFNKLVKRDSTDKFERPANTWLYDKVEIGTWADYTLLVERYTKAISGKDVYDLLGSAAIRDNKLLVFVDGRDNYGEKADGKVGKDDLVRENKEDLDETGTGVLTEIFLDTDTDELSIISVNTYLGKASDDYNEAKEYAPIEVYRDKDDTYTYQVDVEDVKSVEDVKDGEFYLVNISWKDVTKTGEVVAINDVEILEDSTVTKFSAGKDGNGTDRVKKLTTGGTEYKNNVKAWYDKDILNEYNDQLLTNATYNIFLDPYGNFIGVDLFEGTKNYVFITGYDRGRSNISVKTADATGIFLDGTMSTFRVNVTDTDSNIENLYKDYAKRTVADDYAGTNALYFLKWNDVDALKTAGHMGDGGIYNLNQWYTYTENNGVYTLKPCARMTASVYAKDAEVTLKTNRLDVVDDSNYVYPVNSFSGNGKRVYGEDDSTFITVELDVVDTSSGAKAISDVEGVYTGVQNVEIEVNTADKAAYEEGQVYTVYDKNFFIIGAVIVGEAKGADANYAYILSKAKSEEKIDDTYYWEFDAILGGEIKTLTAKSKYHNTIDKLVKGTLKELRFDGDYVINIKPVDNIYGDDVTARINKHDFYDVYSADDQFDGISNTLKLTLEGRTLYITPDQTDVGLALANDCKAVVIQDENKEEDVKTEFTSVKSAIARLADADTPTPGVQYKGRIVAALDGDGVAQWVLFDNDTPLITGANNGDQEVTADNKNAGGTVELGAKVNSRTGDVIIEAKITRDTENVPNSAKATIDYELFVDGKFDQSGFIDVLGGKTSARDVITAMDLPDTAEVEVKITGFEWDAVNVKYVDEKGNDISSKLLKNASDEMTKFVGTASEEAIAAFKVNISGATGSNDMEVKNNQFSGSNALVDEAAVSVGSPFASTNNKAQGKTDGTPVTIVIKGLGSLGQTYELKTAQGLAAAKLAAIDVTSTGKTPVAMSTINADLGDDTIAIKTDKAAATGLNDSTLITFTATLAQGGAAFDANRFTVTLATSEGPVTFEVGPGKLTATATLRIDKDDITINDITVAVRTPLVDVVSVEKTNDYTIEVTFNQGVEKTGAAAVTLTEVAVKATAGGAAISGAVLTTTKGSDTVTIELPAALADGNVVDFGAGVLSSVVTGNTLTAQVWAYSTTTGQFTKNP